MKKDLKVDNKKFSKFLIVSLLQNQMLFLNNIVKHGKSPDKSSSGYLFSKDFFPFVNKYLRPIVCTSGIKQQLGKLFMGKRVCRFRNLKFSETNLVALFESKLKKKNELNLEEKVKQKKPFWTPTQDEMNGVRILIRNRPDWLFQKAPYKVLSQYQRGRLCAVYELSPHLTHVPPLEQKPIPNSEYGSNL